MATVRREPQQKRSQDRVNKILAAAAEVIAEQGVDGLTLAGVGAKAGMPAGTLYRYFADRDELVTMYFEHEMAKNDLAVAQAFDGLKTVSVRTLVETAMYAHLKHHQANPAMAIAWYRSPRARVVDEHARHQDERIGRWIRDAMAKVGFLTDDFPESGEVILVRLADRTFEWIFAESRRPRAQAQAVEIYVDMVVPYLERFSTPVGIRGISGEEFMGALGELVENR